MDSSSRLASYRKLVQEIKSVVKEKNLSRSDNSLVKGLLKVLQFDCEFKILSECYSNSKEFNKVIPDMETVYGNYKKELDLLEEKKKNNQFGGMDNYRYQRLSKAVDRLEIIMQMVKTREFNHYMNAIVASLNESDQIIEVCGTILSEGVQDFSRLFGSNVVHSNEDGHLSVDSDYVDTIYTLLSHSDTIRLAEQYLRSYRLLRIDELKETRDTNARFCEYLSIIQDNLDVFREYMKLIHYSSKKSNHNLAACQAKIASLELEAYESKNILRRNSIQQEIESLNATINTINSNLSRVLELEEEIEILGCKGIIEALDTTVRDSENTPEAKIVQILKPLSKSTFNMNDLIHKTREGIKQQDQEIDRRQKTLDSKLKDIHNPVLKRALKNNPEDVTVLLRMKNPSFGATDEQKSIGVSPYLAALCLKAIKDSKNLTSEEIEQASESYNKAGVFAKIQADNGIVANCLSSINNLVSEVVGRVPYDPNDYEKIALS